MTIAERLDQRLLLYLDEQYGYPRTSVRESSPESPVLSSWESVSTLDRLQLLVSFPSPPRRMPATALPYRPTPRPTTPAVIATTRHQRRLVQTVQASLRGDPDPYVRDPTSHPCYRRLSWKIRLPYALLGVLRVGAHYVIGRSRNSQWFARWAPVLLVVVGTLLISSLVGEDRAASSADPEMQHPPPAVIDSMRSHVEIPKLRALRTAFLHLPARPPIPDSTWVLSSQYGPRRDPVTHQDSFHSGVDLAAQSGTPIRAPARGVVTAIGRSDRSGLYLRLKHPPLPYRSSFAHLSTVTVQRGDTISLRDTIATVGETGRTTGPHLHFRVERNGRPVDPAPLYQQYVSLRDSFRVQARRSRRLVQRSLRRARQSTDTLSYAIVPHLLEIQSRVRSLARVPRVPTFSPRSSSPGPTPSVSSAPPDS